MTEIGVINGCHTHTEVMRSAGMAKAKSILMMAPHGMGVPGSSRHALSLSENNPDLENQVGFCPCSP